MIENYIGITGITRCVQVEKTLELFNHFGFSMDSEHVPMLGFLISPRNLNQDWYSSMYPKASQFKPLLKSAAGRAFNTLHIDSKAHLDWDIALETLVKELDLVDLVDGFQINVKHPELNKLTRLRKVFPHKKIILQYSNDFLELKPRIAYKQIKPYSKLIDYVLMDPSRGRGLGLDTLIACNHYRVLKNNFNLGIGFAGGFNPDNIWNYLDTIIGEIGTKCFSTDIESGLRGAEDNYKVSKAGFYLKNVRKRLNSELA